MPAVGQGGAHGAGEVDGARGVAVQAQRRCLDGDLAAVDRAHAPVARQRDRLLDHRRRVVVDGAGLAARHQPAGRGVGAVGERLRDERQVGRLRRPVEFGRGQPEQRAAMAS